MAVELPLTTSPCEGGELQRRVNVAFLSHHDLTATTRLSPVPDFGEGRAGRASCLVHAIKRRRRKTRSRIRKAQEKAKIPNAGDKSPVWRRAERNKQDRLINIIQKERTCGAPGTELLRSCRSCVTRDTEYGRRQFLDVLAFHCLHWGKKAKQSDAALDLDSLPSHFLNFRASIALASFCNHHHHRQKPQLLTSIIDQY